MCVCEGVFSSSRGSQRKTESRRLKNNDPYSRGAVCVFDYVCASELMFACVCVCECVIGKGIWQLFSQALTFDPSL